MPTPSEIKLRRKSNVLALRFREEVFEIPAELLRVHSPSAEVRGHGSGQAQVPAGKLHVQLTGVEPQGNYAVRLLFDDGHQSGIYTWDYLYELARDQPKFWQLYDEALRAAGKSRDPATAVVKFI